MQPARSLQNWSHTEEALILPEGGLLSAARGQGGPRAQELLSLPPPALEGYQSHFKRSA